MPTHRGRFYAKAALRCRSAADHGETWQVMRLSRNRYWGHPNLVALLKRLADRAHKDAVAGGYWSATYRTRGGPMLTGPPAIK